MSCRDRVPCLTVGSTRRRRRYGKRQRVALEEAEAVGSVGAPTPKRAAHAAVSLAACLTREALAVERGAAPSLWDKASRSCMEVLPQALSVQAQARSRSASVASTASIPGVQAVPRSKLAAQASNETRAAFMLSLIGSTPRWEGNSLWFSAAFRWRCSTRSWCCHWLCASLPRGLSLPASECRSTTRCNGRP